MMRPRVMCRLHALLLLVLPLPIDSVFAQSKTAPGHDSTRTLRPLPSLREVAATLSGERTSLDALLRVAEREAFATRRAVTDVQRTEGALLRTGQAMDPTLSFISGVASDLFGTGQRLAVSSAVTGSMGTTWGSDVSVSYLRQDGSGFDPLRQLAAPSTFAVGLSQQLLEGRNERRAITRAAMRERSAASFALRRGWQQVAAGVEILYWTLAETEAVEAVRLLSLEVAERMLARTRELVRLEMAPEADLLTLRSGVARRKAAVMEARRVRLDASDALLFAAYGERATAVVGRGLIVRTDTGHMGVAYANGHVSSSDPVAMVMDTISEDAVLAKRLDVLAARERLDAAAARASLAQNALRPVVALEGGWATVNNPGTTSAGGVASRSVQGWRTGISISSPLLNRDDRGRLQIADAEHDAEALRVKEVENAVRLELRTARRAVALTRERLVVLQEAALYAERQLEAERQRQDLGLSDPFRLLQTEELAVEARLDAVRAGFDLERAEARLTLAAGAALPSR